MPNYSESDESSEDDDEESDDSCVTDDDWPKFVYWNEEDKVDRDVTVFIKYDPKPRITRYHHSSLLTLRFHKKSPRFTKTGTDASGLLEPQALENISMKRTGILKGVVLVVPWGASLIPRNSCNY